MVVVHCCTVSAFNEFNRLSPLPLGLLTERIVPLRRDKVHCKTESPFFIDRDSTDIGGRDGLKTPGLSTCRRPDGPSQASIRNKRGMSRTLGSYNDTNRWSASFSINFKSDVITVSLRPWHEIQTINASYCSVSVPPNSACPTPFRRNSMSFFSVHRSLCRFSLGITG